jgi:MiaB-like tRNA modifying enzyme
MRVYLEVYGCTANMADAEIIEGILWHSGFLQAGDPAEADLLILVTCTVIDSTQQRMINRLKKLRSYDGTLLVTGCMASAQKRLVKEIAPEAFLLEPREIGKLPEVLKELFGIKIPGSEGEIYECIETLPINKTGLPHKWHAPIGTIPIAEGCFHECSYCITRVARGKLKSYPVDQIREGIKLAVREGCREIRLTAQDTGAWGRDIDKKLSNLLKEVCKIRGEFRIRVGQMNPVSVLGQLAELSQVFRNPKIYKFLHLPVQSGSDRILKLMKREYLVKDFEQIVSRFREKNPDLTLSTDIIVGFPGETEEDFAQSLQLLERVEPDVVNITRFSPRPFTPAKKMDGRILTQIAKERSRKMTGLARQISLERNRRFLGRKCEVVFLENGKKENVSTLGRNLWYKQVVVEGNIQLGSIKKVKITDCSHTSLMGKVEMGKWQNSLRVFKLEPWHLCNEKRREEEGIKGRREGKKKESKGEEKGRRRSQREKGYLWGKGRN